MPSLVEIGSVVLEKNVLNVRYDLPLVKVVALDLNTLESPFR